MISGLLKFAFVGLILWGALTWPGAGLAALAMVVLALLLASLNSSNNHTIELQQLRERIKTLEQNLNASHERVSDDIDRMREQNRRLSNRLDAMVPTPLDDDY